MLGTFVCGGIDHFGHDMLADVVGLLWVMSYIGSVADNRQCLPDKVRKSIPIGVGAVGSAASTPNWLLCHVCLGREIMKE